MNVSRASIACITWSVLTLLTHSASAYESDQSYGYSRSWEDDSENRKLPLLPPNPQRLQKFNLALNTIGIPAEAQPDFSNLPEESTLSESAITARLPLIDPEAGLKRYLTISYGNFSLFNDFVGALLPPGLLDYTLSLANNSAPTDSETLIDKLQKISANAKEPGNHHPLAGLKIVIDPGHMGSDFWDNETGKYVEIGKTSKKVGGKIVTVHGKKVSEGQINLWTAFLVSNALEELGATVKLTRTQDAPVSPYNYQNFVAGPYLNQYFYDSLDDWMAKYLTLSDNEIKASIKQKPEVKKAYTSLQHSQFFVGGEDLEARSHLIDQEQPDVVLDIHYDANLSNQLQTSTNALEAFVPGSFLSTETGSRKLRGFAVKHLLDQRRWNASVDLATEIVNSMTTSEKVPLESKPNFIGSVKVKNGVYARNLYINRRNLSALMVYLECLHYDNTAEFYNMANATEIGTYHGVNFQYPMRIKSVADGIKTGLLNYFRR